MINYELSSLESVLAETIFNVNQYTYRGYRYESETGYYYLNSRYYNPEIGRFINADGIIGETGNILGHNMFAYCQNNPVMFVDPSGYFLKELRNEVKQWHSDLIDDIVENIPDPVAEYIVEHFEVNKKSKTPRCQGKKGSSECGIYYRNIKMRWKDGIHIGDNIEIFGIVDTMKLKGDLSWRGLLDGFNVSGVATAFEGRAGPKFDTKFGKVELGVKGYYGGVGGQMEIGHWDEKKQTFTIIDMSAVAWSGYGFYWRVSPN